jgi:SET domain-containing protein
VGAHGPPEEIPAEVWADERLVTRASRIHGQGLFAAAVIAAWEPVLRLGGRLVSTARLDEMLATAGDDPGAGYVDTVQVAEDAHLVLPPGTVAHYGNHSCDPNLSFDGPWLLRARRAIAAGEELTVDYATCSGPGLTLDCSCGAATCRGRVVGQTSSYTSESQSLHWPRSR